VHTATYLNRSTIRAERAGRAITLDDVFPDWNEHDRLGIVVDSAYGVVGASLLIQIASLLFYEIKPQRREAVKRYPELYAFLVERPAGDLAMFDFYPRRREVVVPRDPAAMVDAVNDRAITRLLVVDGSAGEVQLGWDERNAALDRIVSAYAYSPTGRVAAGDLVLTGSADTELNVTMTLEPEKLIEMVSGWTEADIAAFEPQLLDPDVGFDGEVYAAYARERAPEVSDETRRALVEQRQSVLEDGVPVESYRGVSADDALSLLVPAAPTR
jgi:hypothetical protein